MDTAAAMAAANEEQPIRPRRQCSASMHACRRGFVPRHDDARAPAGRHRLAAIEVGHASCAVSPEGPRPWERRLFVIAIRAHCSSSARAAATEPTFDEKPLLSKLLALDEEGCEAQEASSMLAVPTQASLAAREAKLARYRILLEAAGPSPRLSERIAIRAGFAAGRLARDWRQLEDIARAIAFLYEAAGFYERAGSIEEAAEERREAEDLRDAAAHDIDGASAGDLRRLIGGALAPLERARAFARSPQVATDANAPFDAAYFAEKAAAELESVGFPDPGSVGVEAALTAWIAETAKRVAMDGGRPERMISDIGKMWADILAARHGRARTRTPQRRSVRNISSRRSEKRSSMGG